MNTHDNIACQIFSRDVQPKSYVKYEIPYDSYAELILVLNKLYFE